MIQQLAITFIFIVSLVDDKPPDGGCQISVWRKYAIGCIRLYLLGDDVHLALIQLHYKLHRSGAFTSLGSWTCRTLRVASLPGMEKNDSEERLDNIFGPRSTNNERSLREITLFNLSYKDFQ